MNRKEQLQEYAKCLSDPTYAIETYLETFDQTQSGYVPFHLFPKQKELVHSIFDNRFTIVTKPRQAGITTTTAACMAIKVSFYGDENIPDKILILANRQEIAQEFLKKIKEFLEQIPRWVWGIEYVQDPKKSIFLTDSKKHIILPTKCEIKALATSKDALRGFTPTILVMDEAAYIDNGAEVYGAALPSLGCLDEKTLIITENGLTPLGKVIKDKNTQGFHDLDNPFKVINRYGELENVTKTFTSSFDKTFTIKTKRGLELTGSWKHPILTNKSNKDEWVRMYELNVGDKVLFNYNQNKFGNDNKVDFTYEKSTIHKKLNLPTDLTNEVDLCYLLGLFISEGNYNRSGIQITNGDQQIRDFLNKGLEKYGIQFKEYRKYKFQFISKEFKSYLNYLGFNQVKANNKTIPDKILTLSKPLITSVLQGMFDGDGCSTKKEIKYSSTSKELINRLQILLLNYGIKSNLLSNGGKVNLNICPSDVLKFKKEIGSRFNNEVITNKILKTTIDDFDDNSESNEFYFEDEIVEIEEFYGNTYDLHLPETNSFISNGFISHNTGGKSVLISCVTKDTMVFTDKGIREINDFLPNENLGPEQINTYNVLGKDKIRSGNIIHKNGFVDTLKIKTVHSNIEGSLNHKLWVYDSLTKEYGWKKLEDIKLDDYLSVQYGLNIWGDIEIGNEMSYLLGQYITKNHSKKNITDLIKKFPPFIEYLNSILNNKDKSIPTNLLSLNRENSKHLLKGIFDELGVSYDNDGLISITLPTRKMMEQVMLLLNNFGILSIIKSNKSFKITLSGVDSLKFYDEIGFNFERKQNNKLILETKKVNRSSPYDVIPNGKKYLKKLVEEIKKVNPKKLSGLRLSVEKDNISRDLLLKVLSISKELNIDTTFIDGILSNNIKWVKVRSIDKNKNWTYDFSLPNNEEDFWSHSVVYNGLLGHQTPNGYDDLYYKIYDGAVNKRNKYNVVEMRWYQDLRYNKDLKWVKGEEVIPEQEYRLESYRKMIELGYKPSSPWYESMCAEYNGDTRKIAQELDVSFLGSGGNVIDEEYVENQNKYNVKSPIRTEGFDNGVWIWEEPQVGHRYILGSDVSRGDSEDFSTIQIIDFETREQVMEYQGKIPPDVLAEIVYNYGQKYKAYVVVDITGGMGVTTVLKLVEMEYKNLHFDDPKSKVLSTRKDLGKFKKYDNKVPGFNVGANRLNMVAEFERCIRQNEVIIRSSRLISEMKTFVYRNGRPDHMDGYHDDLLMGVAMCLWVLQTSFKNLEKVNEQTKAILNSWVTSSTVNTPNLPTTQKPNLSTPQPPPNIPNGDHMWLFGGMS